jgi:Cu2+-exporting ATPase
VIGGSRNITSPLLVHVEAVGPESTLAMIRALLDRALLDRPPAVRAADRWARYFVTAVILVAVGVGFAWWRISPEDALWVVLSVLVATCPCALSLATPAALASATHALVESGFLIARGHVLETLARTTHIVFDKTGTLTEGGASLAQVIPVAGRSIDEVLALAGALESGSEHPIAQAFPQPGEGAAILDLRAEPNCGVTGKVGGRALRLGRPDWVAQLYAPAETREISSLEPPRATDGSEQVSSGRSWILLADEAGPLAWFGMAASTRSDAREAVSWLGREGLEVTLLSGDPSQEAVSSIASELGILESVADATPAQKLEVVEQMQRDGAILAAVGDGVNDAPILGRADVSIAMGGGTDLARMSADAVLLGDRLSALPRAFDLARRTRSIIRQNLGWAVLYNLAILPLAALGYVQPWMAAIGMSASSLLVVANALRLSRSPTDP